MKRADLPKSTATVQVPAIATPTPEAAAPDLASAVGLIKRGTPVPMDSRDTARKLAFEDGTKRRIVIDRLKRGFAKKVVLTAVGWASHWSDWRKKASRGLEPYASFMYEIDEAEAEGACHLMDQIERAGEGAPDQHGVWKNQWQASKYLLEVNNPAVFKPVEKSFSVNMDVPAEMVKFDVTQMTDEQLEKMVDFADQLPVIDAEVVKE